MKPSRELRLLLSRSPIELIESYGEDRLVHAVRMVTADRSELRQFERHYERQFERFVREQILPVLLNVLDLSSAPFCGALAADKLGQNLLTEATLAALNDFNTQTASIRFAAADRFWSACERLHSLMSRWIHNLLLATLSECELGHALSLRRSCTSRLRAAVQWHHPQTLLRCVRAAFSYGFELATRGVNQERVAPLGASLAHSPHAKFAELSDEPCDLCDDIRNHDSPPIDTSGSDYMTDANSTSPAATRQQARQRQRRSVAPFDDDDAESSSHFCICRQQLTRFEQANRQLRALDLLDVLAEDAVESVLHEHVRRHVRERCANGFERPALLPLEQWANEIALGWLRIVYCEDPKCEPLPSAVSARLLQFVHETYAAERTAQLFDIVVEYPESKPALVDLAQCVEQYAGLRKRMASALRSAFDRRLLHPGVATHDVLTAYTQAIRALRTLDPSGVLLQLVADPLKKYLKRRPDTVKCIINALTDDGGELAPELSGGTATATTSESSAAHTPEEEEDPSLLAENWHRWAPDPLDAGCVAEPVKAIRHGDMIGLLVNVYESKQLFVDEYQRLLARRLLGWSSNSTTAPTAAIASSTGATASTSSATDTSTTDTTGAAAATTGNSDVTLLEHERRNLELLALRFGQSDLDACEVMLNDLNSSQRIDSRISSGEISDHTFNLFEIKCLVVSCEFWPENLGVLSSDEMAKYRHVSGETMDRSSHLKLPEPVLQAIETYTKAFETLRANRTLYWIHSLGQVELELELDNGRSLTFTVSPVHAAIIWHFQQRDRWSVSELSQCLALPTTVLRRKIVFWQNRGVLRELRNDLFVLVHSSASSSPETGSDQTLSNADFLEETILEEQSDDDSYSQ
jgi:anaphase-promoting complex subunit 2